MGKLDMFMLSFDNQIATYYAGQVLSGKVKVSLKEPMPMRGIYLRLEGKAYVHWTERHRTRGHGGRNKSKTVHRSATNIYFDLKQCMWGKGIKEILAAGYYEFPFSMTLPANLPTSFEGSHGHVRYHCQANIDRPWKFDPKCKAAFTVLSVVDLNVIPDAPTSVRKENYKELGFCCFGTGTLTTTATINKIGVVPGENIFINATIENHSGKIMNKSSAVLMTRIAYRAQHHMKSETKVVAELVRGPIPARGQDNWVNVPLKVPPLPPTGGCQLINVEYYLLFKVEPSGIAFDLEIELPVIIGTIPLRMDFTHFHAASAPAIAQFGDTDFTLNSTAQGYFEPQQPSAPIPVASFDPSAPPLYETLVKDNYPDLPPPCYEECVYGKVNIKEEEDDEHTGGQLDYTPRYTYYNLN